MKIETENRWKFKSFANNKNNISTLFFGQKILSRQAPADGLHSKDHNAKVTVQRRWRRKPVTTPLKQEEKAAKNSRSRFFTVVARRWTTPTKAHGPFLSCGLLHWRENPKYFLLKMRPHKSTSEDEESDVFY